MAEVRGHQKQTQQPSTAHLVVHCLFSSYRSLKPRTTFWMRMTLSVMALSRSISSSMSWWSWGKRQGLREKHTRTTDTSLSSQLFLKDELMKIWKLSEMISKSCHIRQILRPLERRLENWQVFIYLFCLSCLVIPVRCSHFLLGSVGTGLSSSPSLRASCFTGCSLW